MKPRILLNELSAIMPIPIIGIAGPIESGKNTVADIITTLGWSETIHFADEVRDSLLKLDPLIIHDNIPQRLSAIIERIGWDVAKRTNYEVRRLMQKFGTECGRDVHGEGCWVNIAAQKVLAAAKHMSHLSSPYFIVMPDVRFLNEVTFIKQFGLGVLYIERDVSNSPEAQHRSERMAREIKPYCRTIDNNGTLDQLRESVVNVVRELSRPYDSQA